MASHLKVGKELKKEDIAVCEKCRVAFILQLADRIEEIEKKMTIMGTKLKDIEDRVATLERETEKNRKYIGSSNQTMRNYVGKLEQRITDLEQKNVTTYLK